MASLKSSSKACSVFLRKVIFAEDKGNTRFFLFGILLVVVVYVYACSHAHAHTSIPPAPLSPRPPLLLRLLLEEVNGVYS